MSAFDVKQLATHHFGEHRNWRPTKSSLTQSAYTANQLILLRLESLHVQFGFGIADELALKPGYYIASHLGSRVQTERYESCSGVALVNRKQREEHFEGGLGALSAVERVDDILEDVGSLFEVGEDGERGGLVGYTLSDDVGVVQKDLLGHDGAGTASKEEGALTARNVPYECRGIRGICGKALGVVLRSNHDTFRVAAAVVGRDREVLGQRLDGILEDDAVSWGAGDEQEMGAVAGCVVVETDIR